MDERRLSVKKIREFMAAELFFGLLLFLRYYEGLGQSDERYRAGLLLQIRFYFQGTGGNLLPVAGPGAAL